MNTCLPMDTCLVGMTLCMYACIPVHGRWCICNQYVNVAMCIKIQRFWLFAFDYLLLVGNCCAWSVFMHAWVAGEWSLRANAANWACCFCLEENAVIASNPCGHRCICATCKNIFEKQRDKTCPWCGERVQSFFGVYDSWLISKSVTAAVAAASSP